MSGEVLFLVNPSAGGGRARRVLGRVAAAAQAAGARLELSESGRDLTARAQRAVAGGAARVVVVGGDGSVHLAVQALAGAQTELAVVPTGRGDDFSSSLGVPASVEDAAELALVGSARAVDLIRVELPGRGTVWCATYAGLGLDSAVTRTANTQPRWIPAGVTYIVAALRTLIRFRGARVAIEHDGGRFEGRALLVTACNAPRLGGGMRLAPEALVDDGRLDLVTLREVSLPVLFGLFPKVFSGRHVGHPAVSIVRCREARITVGSPWLLGADGEVEGECEGEPIEISVAPRALRVVAPSG